MVTVHTNYENLKAYKKAAFGLNWYIYFIEHTNLTENSYFLHYSGILFSHFHKQTGSET